MKMFSDLYDQIRTMKSHYQLISFILQLQLDNQNQKRRDVMLSTTNDFSSMMVPSNADGSTLDYTEIDQGLNLWSDLFPMIEKEIGILTTVAQEMQECSEREKYVDILLKIAQRVNDVEEKATTCIKEARTQLKKTQLIDRQRENNDRILHSTRVHARRDDDEDDDEDEDEMDVDESHINEQIEVSALSLETLEKLQQQIEKVLIKPTDPNGFQIDADHRYSEFAECISKMQNNDDDDEANVVDQLVSNRCPLTQKELVEPVQNRKCKHKYEKTMVLKYIADRKKARRPVKCPSAGCENLLDEKDLINVS